MYLVGIVFFAGTWAVERFALLRINRTPPPYSFELITSTLGWMPFAVCFHLFFAAWGFASLPSAPLGSSTWEPPYNASEFEQGSGTVNYTNVDMSAQWENDVLGPFTGSLATNLLYVMSYVYNMDSVNSLPTFILISASWLSFIYLAARVIRATGLCYPIEVGIRRGARATYRIVRRKGDKVAPADKGLSEDHEKRRAMAAKLAAGQILSKEELAMLKQASMDALAKKISEGKVLNPDEMAQLKQAQASQPADEYAEATSEEEIVIDPPFSVVLKGISRDNVRCDEDGTIVHESQLKLRHDLLDKIMGFTPTMLMFRLLGMFERREPISKEEWDKATPLFTRLTRAADISYQPEFHPTYEKAFVFMKNPEQLDAFNAAKDAKKKAEEEAAARRQRGRRRRHLPMRSPRRVTRAATWTTPRTTSKRRRAAAPPPAAKKKEEPVTVVEDIDGQDA